MTTLFSDNFNRADSTSLGTSWSEVAGDWQVQTNQLLISSGAGFRVCSTTTTAHAAVADCKVTATRAAGASWDAGPCVRLSGAGGSETCYYLDVSGTQDLSVIRRVAGADTDIGDLVQAHSNGDIYALQVSGSGATVTLKVFRNGSQVGADITDTAGSRITAAGQTGVVTWAGAAFDDFLVEDLGGGGGGSPLLSQVESSMHRGMFRGTR